MCTVQEVQQLSCSALRLACNACIAQRRYTAASLFVEQQVLNKYVVKPVQDAVDFFALLEKLYVFMSGAVAHRTWLDVQTELFPSESPRQLQRLSDTRWACRVTACRNIRDRLHAVMLTLDKLYSEANAERALDARSLLLMVDFKFVLLLCLFCDLLGKVHVVSNQLQSSSIDLSCAAELVTNLLDTLKASRDDDDAMCSIISTAEALCAQCGIEPSLVNRRKRKSALPRRLADSVVEQAVGQRESINTQTEFRQHVLLPVLDCLISELESRFSQEANAVMLGIQALTPNCSSFLSNANLEAFSVIYKGNVEDMGHEIHQLKRLLQRTEQNTNRQLTGMLELARFLEPYKLAFAELYRLVSIALVLPVTSAACERSFSALQVIKNYLRSSMCDSRLSNLAVLSVESARAKAIDFEAFVDEFDSRHQNRKLALH